jgi:hypothetical protein
MFGAKSLDSRKTSSATKVSILSNQFLAEVRGYSGVRLIRLAKDMREANVRGEKLGLSEDELGDEKCNDRLTRASLMNC